MQVGRKDKEGREYIISSNQRSDLLLFTSVTNQIPIEVFPVIQTCMNTCIYAHNTHTHTRTSPYTQPTSPLFYSFLRVYISVVIFGCAHCCQPTNSFRWYISLNSSTCSCPPTLTFQARSFCDLLSREAILSQ